MRYNVYLAYVQDIYTVVVIYLVIEHKIDSFFELTLISFPS